MSMMSGRIKLPFKLGDSKKTNEVEVNEILKKDDFSLSEIVRYGFPYRPTTLAYDPVQKILAIGTKGGIIKIYGGAFVECSLPHPTEVEIVQLVFRINEGALISACRDNYIHLWSLRQKKPVIANSLRFVKEKICRCLLPLAFNSKWLLVGTSCGNVYVVNLDTFTLSSYKIMWNNAIGMGKSSHPGAVVDLCQNPDDPTKIYIGFSTHLTSPNSVPIGHVVCWNFQQKTSESVYTLPQGLTSLSWHHEGRQFMCSHCDGSLSVWNLRATDKPVSINYPHTRICKDEALKFGPINKVIWSSVKSSSEPFIIFSGGMPSQTEQQSTSATLSTNPSGASPPSKPSSYFLTILRGQTTNVLHMDNAIVDFLVLTSSPHIADVPDPSAVVVLLENDLVVIDLKTENYPLFESLHTMDLHESPVTYCDYLTDPNPNLYQNLLRLQSKQTLKRTFSQQENPISGGKSGSTIFGYNELILTGHVDGSIKFWDASGCNLLFLYKLRTSRLFDRVQHNKETTAGTSSSTATYASNKDQSINVKFDNKSTRANSNVGDEQQQQAVAAILTGTNNEWNGYDHPYAIYSIKICCEGKYLIAAARGGHVTLFKFTGPELDKADEGLGDLSCLEVPILHRNLSGDTDETSGSGNAPGAGSESTSPLARQAMHATTDKRDFKSLLRAKMGYRRMPGYQPELVCLLSWLPTEKVPILTDIAINSKFGLLIFGLDNGLVVIDYLSKFILMNMATSDLYGTMDPFQRTTMSPKRRGPSNEGTFDDPTSSSYDHPQQSSNPSSNAADSGGSVPGSVFAFNHVGQVSSSKNRPTTSTRISSRRVSSTGPTSIQVFRSRSIDSISAKDCPIASRPPPPPPIVNDEKQTSSSSGTTQSTTMIVKKFRTLRKRLSRTSNTSKQSISPNHVTFAEGTLNEKEDSFNSGIKSTGEDSEASSAGEELNQQASSECPTATTSSSSAGTQISLGVHRSLPAQKSPSMIPSTVVIEPTETHSSIGDDDENEIRFSKTWSPSTFTGDQLRGTCSLEYTEHMREKSNRRKTHMIDLRKDNSQQSTTTQTTTVTLTGKHSLSSSMTNYTTNSVTTSSNKDKPLMIDLPRSASNSSMDSILTNESVCAIQFSESFTYKNDATLSPSVWLGTSAGCVIVVNLNIIYEPRNISVVPSGTVFRLCGRLLHISFLDQKGVIIPSPSEKWDTKKTKANRSADGFTQPQDLNTSSGILGGNTTSSSGMGSPSSTSPLPTGSTQYAVFCSSKQARVVSLPSQVCMSKQKIHESLGASASNIMRASVVKIAGSSCLTCYLSGGRIHVYSLPSLRELYSTTLENITDSFRSLVASTFTFTNRGHGLYMCSPTEIQKITISGDIKEQINEMLCELYSPSISMPDAPRPNFFAKLFASNSMIDSDQLFGEAAGKAPFGIAKKEDVNVNMNQMRGKVDSANSVVNETRMKLIQRGEKLNDVDVAARQMTERAEEFASLSHKVMLKQKEKAEWSWFTSKKS